MWLIISAIILTNCQIFQWIQHFSKPNPLFYTELRSFCSIIIRKSAFSSAIFVQNYTDELWSLSHARQKSHAIWLLGAELGGRAFESSPVSSMNSFIASIFAWTKLSINNSIIYSTSNLLRFRGLPLLKIIRHNQFKRHLKDTILAILRTKKRGKRSVWKVRLQRLGTKTPLPAVLLTNCLLTKQQDRLLTKQQDRRAIRVTWLDSSEEYCSGSHQRDLVKTWN